MHTQFKPTPVETRGKERREEQKDDTGRFLIARHMIFRLKQ